MLKITHTNRTIADVIASVRDVPTQMIPYAAAKALTRTAKQAEKVDVPAEMRKAFAGVTSWTLNSLRTEIATKDKLSARVSIKNVVQPGAVKPENFLLPQVDGGGRNRKRSENSLGYSGILTSGQYVMPGKGLELDASGNVPGGEMKTILQAVKKTQGEKIKGKRSAGVIAMSQGLFIGKPRGRKLSGIWKREGEKGNRTLRALFIIPTRAPRFSKRLDFTGTVRRLAEKRFPAEFEKAVAEEMAKSKWKNA